jgi:hypothetical protein
LEEKLNKIDLFPTGLDIKPITKLGKKDDNK